WLPSWLDHFGLGMLLAVTSVWYADRRTTVPAGLERRWAPAVSWAVAGVAFWLVSTQMGVAVNYTLFTTRDEMVVHVMYAVAAFRSAATRVTTTRVRTSWPRGRGSSTRTSTSTPDDPSRPRTTRRSTSYISPPSRSSASRAQPLISSRPRSPASRPWSSSASL